MILDQQKIGFIGFGNMGQAIAEGWIKSGKIGPDLLYASTPNQERLKENTESLGITVTESNLELAETVDIMIITMKTYQINKISNS